VVGARVDESSERDAAHAWAASFRRRREVLRSDLTSGSVTLGQALEGADASDDGAVKLRYVLESLPGAAKVATRRHLADLGLDESTPLRDLSPEQRAMVLREFPLPASGAPGEPASGAPGEPGSGAPAEVPS